MVLYSLNFSRHKRPGCEVNISGIALRAHNATKKERKKGRCPPVRRGGSKKGALWATLCNRVVACSFFSFPVREHARGLPLSRRIASLSPSVFLLHARLLGLWLFLTMRVARQSTTPRWRAILVHATGPNPHYPRNRLTDTLHPLYRECRCESGIAFFFSWFSEKMEHRAAMLWSTCTRLRGVAAVKRA